MCLFVVFPGTRGSSLRWLQLVGACFILCVLPRSGAVYSFVQTRGETCCTFRNESMAKTRKPCNRLQK